MTALTPLETRLVANLLNDIDHAGIGMAVSGSIDLGTLDGKPLGRVQGSSWGGWKFVPAVESWIAFGIALCACAVALLIAFIHSDDQDGPLA